MFKLYLLIIFLVFTKISFAGQKIDTVYFQNGDKITCEFKYLENNLLHISTKNAGSLNIEWDMVDSLYIKELLLILLDDGENVIGKILPSKTKNSLIIDAGLTSIKINQLSIVKMYPYRERFFKRFSGDLGTSFSYTKVNKHRAFEFNGKLKYTTRKYVMSSSYDANITNQESTEQSQRHQALLDYNYILKNKFFYNATVLVEKNTELALDLRTNTGVGLGNFFIFNNYSQAYGTVGIQGNREFSEDSVATNIEGVFLLSYTIFKYSYPKIDLTMSSVLYPNLIDFERIRTTINSKLRWEVHSNLYLKYTLYHTFDNKPLTEGAEKSDWSVSVGIEYSFN